MWGISRRKLSRAPTAISFFGMDHIAFTAKQIDACWDKLLDVLQSNREYETLYVKVKQSGGTRLFFVVQLLHFRNYWKIARQAVNPKEKKYFNETSRQGKAHQHQQGGVELPSQTCS